MRGKRREVSRGFLIAMSFILSQCILAQSIQVIFTDLILIKIINLISIIFLASFIGAFIREIFVIKERASWRQE